MLRQDRNCPVHILLQYQAHMWGSDSRWDMDPARAVFLSRGYRSNLKYKAVVWKSLLLLKPESLLHTYSRNHEDMAKASSLLSCSECRLSKFPPGKSVPEGRASEESEGLCFCKHNQRYTVFQVRRGPHLHKSAQVDTRGMLSGLRMAGTLKEDTKCD